MQVAHRKVLTLKDTPNKTYQKSEMSDTESHIFWTSVFSMKAGTREESNKVHEDIEKRQIQENALYVVNAEWKFRC